MMYRSILTGLFFVLLFQHSQAQEQLSKKQRADLLFERYQYDKCLALYLDLAENSAYDITVVEHIADCYRLMNKYESAELWYAKVLTDTRATKQSHYNYAQVLLRNLKTIGAKEQFRQYYVAIGKPELFAAKSAMCDSAFKWLRQASGFAVKNEPKLSSAFSDWGITYFGSNGFVFASDRTKNTSKKGTDIYDWTGSGYLKLYEVKGDAITPLPVNADERYHIGPIAFNSKQDTAYITVTTDLSKGDIAVDAKAKGQKQRLYTRRLELMMAVKMNGRWGNFVPFENNDASHYSVGHACLAENGHLLYFTSDMPGGQGKTDIWYCEKQADGKWGKPVNCGNVINTAEEEAFATMGGDGALYLASKGLPGMGGYDIFKAKGDRANWSVPINLKYPLNSTSDDFALITRDGASGYYSSNRQGGQGDDDIYSFDKQVAGFGIVLQGYAYDKNTGKRIDSAEITLKSPVGTLLNRSASLISKDFFFKLDKQQDYIVEARKQGYYPVGQGITTKGITGDDTIHVKLPMEALMVDKTFVLKDVYYDLDKFNIRPDAAAELDKLVAIMMENPALKIELSSHTDSRASDEYNMILSDKRAKSAVAYLVSKGISSSRMTAKGYGETRLLNQCANGVNCTEAEHQLNRRTEIKIVGN